MPEISVEDKERALRLLNKRPDDFRWTIHDVTLTIAMLIEQVEIESGTGAVIVGLTKELAEDNSGSNALGKRYQCLVCGTVILVTKAGEGKVNCCEQDMEIREPRPAPSSD